jgi:hypothetical protein
MRPLLRNGLEATEREGIELPKRIEEELEAA